MQQFKLIIRVGDVPTNSVVTKRTGEKAYRVQDRLRVFGTDSKPQEIKADAGCRFLVPEGGSGDVNAVGVDTEVVWLADADDILALIDPPDNN